jgi:hypothetical protein
MPFLYLRMAGIENENKANRQGGACKIIMAAG